MSDFALSLWRCAAHMTLTEGARLSDTHQFHPLSGWWSRTEGPSRFTELQLRGPQTEGLKDKDRERVR